MNILESYSSVFTSKNQVKLCTYKVQGKTELTMNLVHFQRGESNESEKFHFI